MIRTKGSKKDNPSKGVVLISGLILLAGAFLYYYIEPDMWFADLDNETVQSLTSPTVDENGNDIEEFDIKSLSLKFNHKDFTTDFSKSSINLEDIISGGPSKDEIPAITSARFVSIENSETPLETPGIFVDFNEQKRFYPYDILTWHEIVNDNIGDTYFAVTYCPLCGSAIVYNRVIDDMEYYFGVSGLLHESNMIMYDIGSESFWSQSRGESIVGENLGKKLEVLPMQLMMLSEVKEKYPETAVLSRETGYRREYDINPYSGYEDSEELLEKVSFEDKRYSTKEIMYVIPVKDSYVTFPNLELEEGVTQTTEIDDIMLSVERTDGEIIAKVNDEATPGYYEMWFSWVVQHQDDGVIWEFE